MHFNIQSQWLICMSVAETFRGETIFFQCSPSMPLYSDLLSSPSITSMFLNSFKPTAEKKQESKYCSSVHAHTNTCSCIPVLYVYARTYTQWLMISLDWVHSSEGCCSKPGLIFPTWLEYCVQTHSHVHEDICKDASLQKQPSCTQNVLLTPVLNMGELLL